MFIYNVTVHIEKDVEEKWVKWMKETHMPDVVKSGCFIDSQLLKVWGPEDLGPTYSAQYKFQEMADIERYQKDFAAGLQAEHKIMFGEAASAFRTVLQIM